jgi:hypothetical protein
MMSCSMTGALVAVIWSWMTTNRFIQFSQDKTLQRTEEQANLRRETPKIPQPRLLFPD